MFGDVTRKVFQQLGRARWLRFGVRDRIIRAYHHPDRCRPEQFSQPFFNLTYEGRFDQFIDWSIFYYGAYAAEELDFLADVLESLDEPVFVDIGANAGQHSLFASRFAGAVHAFEPYPLVADEFAGRIARNGIQNIRLHRVGLGSTNAVLAFHPPTTRNLGTGSFTSGNGDSIPLEVCKADEYFAANGIDRVDLIKIDTEGFEVEVLKGLRQTLERCLPIVFFEWTSAPDKESVEDAFSLFPKHYRLFRFVPEVVFAVFFRKRSYTLRKAVCPLSSGNYAAVPDERANRLVRVCRSLER